jgi:hypothetical protein
MFSMLGMLGITRRLSLRKKTRNVTGSDPLAPSPPKGPKDARLAISTAAPTLPVIDVRPPPVPSMQHDAPVCGGNRAACEANLDGTNYSSAGTSAGGLDVSNYSLRSNKAGGDQRIIDMWESAMNAKQSQGGMMWTSSSASLASNKMSGDSLLRFFPLSTPQRLKRARSINSSNSLMDSMDVSNHSAYSNKLDLSRNEQRYSQDPEDAPCIERIDNEADASSASPQCFMRRIPPPPPPATLEVAAPLAS